MHPAKCDTVSKHYETGTEQVTLVSNKFVGTGSPKVERAKVQSAAGVE